MASDEQVNRLEIRMLLDMLARSAKRDLERRLAVSQVQISSLQYLTLRLLHHQSHTVSELSRLLNHEPNALVQVVDALERGGLVDRQRDPHDRRRNPLVLTPAGVKTLAQVPVLDQQDALALGLSAMGATKTVQLLDLLRELAPHLISEVEVWRNLPELARQMIEAAPQPSDEK